MKPKDKDKDKNKDKNKDKKDTDTAIAVVEVVMPATDQQVQQFVNERVRPRAQQIRALLLSMEDDKSAIDDVYAALNVQSPTWNDQRSDGPPHLLTPANVLGWNAFITAIIEAMREHGELATVLSACVHPV